MNRITLKYLGLGPIPKTDLGLLAAVPGVRFLERKPKHVIIGLSTADSLNSFLNLVRQLNANKINYTVEQERKDSTHRELK